MTTPDQRLVRRITAADPDGVLSEQDGRWVLAMTRAFPAPPERVWPWLTETDRLARWSPIVPDGDGLDRVGPATSHEQPGAPGADVEVLVADPPRELVHRWGRDRLRWTLTSEGDGTLLRLEHTFDRRPDASSFGAGWHICLAGLAAHVAGEDAERPVGDRAMAYGWAPLRDRYDDTWSVR